MDEIEIPIILLKNKFNFKRRKARNSLAQAEALDAPSPASAGRLAIARRFNGGERISSAKRRETA